MTRLEVRFDLSPSHPDRMEVGPNDGSLNE